MVEVIEAFESRMIPFVAYLAGRSGILLGGKLCVSMKLTIAKGISRGGRCLVARLVSLDKTSPL